MRMDWCVLGKKRESITLSKASWCAQAYHLCDSSDAETFREQCAHSGRKTTSNVIQASEFWIVVGRGTVSPYIPRGVQCRKLWRLPVGQKYDACAWTRLEKSDHRTENLSWLCSPCNFQATPPLWSKAGVGRHKLYFRNTNILKVIDVGVFLLGLKMSQPSEHVLSSEVELGTVM